MGVDYEAFFSWANDHFGPENIRIKGNEILTHTPFTDDRKFHLWMNPSGGKKERAGGAYRCWYTDRKGSLISLVAELDSIPYEEAEELICNITSLRSLEKKVEEFFSPKDTSNEVVITHALHMPAFTCEIDSMSATNIYRSRAITYLNSRKIPTTGLHVCSQGDYKNRIIIPYYDCHDNLIYYNARTMSSNPNLMRYMKPDDKQFNQTQVLYFPSWPRPRTKVYLTEGEFDALSLNVSGLHGAACGGKFLSDAQVETLRPYIPVLAFDTDEGSTDSGGEALLRIGQTLLEKGFTEIYFVRPPLGYKDWNKLLVEKNKDLVKAYIERFERTYSDWTASKLLADRL